MTFPGGEDPFQSVQKEVQESWDAIFAEFQRWAKTSAQDAVSALPAREALENKLHTLDWDISDLQEAVRIAREDPTKFRLTPSQLSSRENFVLQMTQNVHQLQATLAASGGNDDLNREVLLSGVAENPRQVEAREANENFINDEMQHQELIMEQQDEDLDHLASAVERIGLMGHEMHQEFAEQGLLLDGLGDDMDNTRTRMSAVREKLDRFIADAGPKQFCTIVGLSITLLVLTVLVATT